MSRSVLEPIPVSSLAEEIEKFGDLPPYLFTSQAATVMMVTNAGAMAMHDSCEYLSRGRNELGHRLYSRDECVARRWARLRFSNVNDNEPTFTDATAPAEVFEQEKV
ncbi:hypothetical protein Q669_00565 [Labrenzia sp. C1B10]|uniref:hypothetical protein n=1 Tax=unclassified Labrenzia TaxID=2648686 RepID=UPI0003B911C3|nr:MULTISPECIES: hypothetical protein [unclassified Labrenzia]ERP98783.1 hypothetical protein Q669_00565 [Labrenzia sp. C1B10]ERS00948.1 hypothetical protein Q675_09080 [Labrenzia sp. C1B70]